MCRFLAYSGPPTLMQELLLDSSHSLVRQSRHAMLGFEPVNGDGFGVGWYPAHDDPVPGIFVSIEPAWSNRNLRQIASKVYTGHFFAHVRDASSGMPVSQSNCHPFQAGPYLWMHNGFLPEFGRYRRTLLEGLSDESFAMIRGNTDSEYAFALFLDELGHDMQADGSKMAEALINTIKRLVHLKREAGCMSEAHMNFAVTNGNAALFTRYRADSDQPPPTLFYHDGDAVIVASEPLFEPEGWTEVNPGQVLIAGGGRLEFKSIDVTED